jgi:FkbM family methyltransferase
MPYPLAWVLQVLRHLLRLAVYKPAAWRRPLALTYLRLRVLSLFIRGAKENPPRCVRLLSGRLWFYRYESAALLLEEVFIRQQYDAPLEGERPRIVDCGANIGFTVLFFKARHPHARILAFEPNPTAFALLEKNVEGNGLTDVQLVNQGVAADEGTMHVFDDADEPGSMIARVLHEPSGRGPAVEMTRLSSWLDEPVDLLKLDIEDAEFEVLEELRAADKLRLVRQMIIEYHHHRTAGDDRFASSLSRLESDGYGYELLVQSPLPFERDRFQSVHVYAYRR